jgi:hypothetical protein
MTRKHFVAAAETVAAIENLERRKTAAHSFAKEFARANPRFDRVRFFTACNVESK